MNRTATALWVGILAAVALAAVVERRATARLVEERESVLRLDDLARADAAIQTHVLELRAGTSLTFDPIIRGMRSLRAASKLKGPEGRGDPLATWQEAETGRLASDLREKERQVESFKTDLSLLRNSSLHFPRAASELVRTDPDGIGVVDPLRTHVARFTVSPNKDLADRIARQMDAIDASPAPVDVAAVRARRSMLGHARAILERRERVDDLVRKISGSRAHARIAALRLVHDQRRGRAVVVAAVTRTALAALGLLALVVLGEAVASRRAGGRTTRAAVAPASLQPSGKAAPPA